MILRLSGIGLWLHIQNGINQSFKFDTNSQRKKEQPLKLSKPMWWACCVSPFYK